MKTVVIGVIGADVHAVGNKIIDHVLSKNGYNVVSLYRDGKKKNFHVHTLVASGFHLKKDELLVVNHKDGNKLNNHYLNLEWVTRGYNCTHAFDLGLSKHGEKHGSSTISKETAYCIARCLSINKLTQREISNIFNVSQSHISNIKNKKRREREIV